MTTTITASILGHAFDLDRLAEIATHGADTGINGFIYSDELHDLYEANENTIMDRLDEEADSVGEQNGFRMVLNSLERRNIEYSSLQVFKEYAVWFYLEVIAREVCERHEHPDFV